MQESLESVVNVTFKAYISQKKQRNSERGIRTLDTTGMNRVL